MTTTDDKAAPTDDSERIECPECAGRGGCELCNDWSSVEVIQTIELGSTYKVIRGKDDRVPYFLVGKRGAFYGLMRNEPNPHMLFTFNARNFTRSSPDAWLSDQSGELVVVSW